MSNKKQLKIYFGKIMREFFAVGTPKYYKVSISNPKTLLEELQNYISTTNGTSYLQFDHVKYLIDEYLYRSKKDIIFKDYKRDFIVFNNFLEDKIKQKDIKGSELYHFIDELNNRISPIIRNLRLNYFKKTTTSLLSILNKKDSEITPGDFTILKKICYSFSTEILRKGYSKYYIYENIQNYLIYGNDSNDTKNFIQLFNSEINNFNIYIKVITNNKDIQKIFINNFGCENVFDNFPLSINKESIKKESEKKNLAGFLQKNKGDSKCFWLRSTENSIDYVNASNKLVSKVYILLDELKYEYTNENIAIFHHGVSENLNGEINLPLTSDSIYVHRRNSSIEYFKSKNEKVQNIYNSDIIHISTKRKVETIFKFYRYFLESDTIEHKFLNLWIGWEHIFSLNFAKESQTWANIHKYYPLIDSLSYVEDILHDMLQVQLNRSRNIKDLEKLLSNNTKYCVTNLYKIIKDKSERWNDLMMLDCVKNNDLLKVKLFRLHEKLKSPKKFVENNRNKVKWNLYRLYRVRNAIVHKGSIESLGVPIEMLASDLENYYTNLLDVILSRFSANNRFENIEQLFTSIDNTYQSFQKEEGISKISDTDEIKKKIINLPLIF